MFCKNLRFFYVEKIKITQLIKEQDSLNMDAFLKAHHNKSLLHCYFCLSFQGEDFADQNFEIRLFGSQNFQFFFLK